MNAVLNGEDLARFAAMQAIEALRSGVPSRFSTRLLPDLRKEITSLIEDDLKDFAAGKTLTGRMVWGQYGQGKTHVLTAVEHMALDMGFAVSLVSLSREVSCHNLGAFYSRAAQRLRTPDSSVYGIYNRLAGKKFSDLHNTPILEKGRYVHPMPVLVLEEFFHAGEEERELLYSDLMGLKIKLSEIKNIYRKNHREQGLPFPRWEENFKLKQHMTAYFGLMADLVRFCGYKGWVILIDEVELMGRLGRKTRLEAYKNLYWLLNLQGEHDYPIYVVAAAASRLQSDLWYGDKNSDRENMPKLAAEAWGAEWGEKMGYFFEWAVSCHNPTVEPVKEERLLELLQKLIYLHGIAYGKKIEFNPEEVLHKLGETTVRTYIRGMMEVLDQLYLYGVYKVPKVAEMEEEDLTEDEDFFADFAYE